MNIQCPLCKLYCLTFGPDINGETTYYATCCDQTFTHREIVQIGSLGERRETLEDFKEHTCPACNGGHLKGVYSDDGVRTVQCMRCSKRYTHKELRDSVNDLRSALRAFRNRRANALKQKFYMVFTNQTIEDIIEKRPRNLGELSNVHGIGPVKIRDFGIELLEIIARVTKTEVPNKEGEVMGEATCLECSGALSKIQGWHGHYKCTCCGAKVSDEQLRNHAEENEMPILTSQQRSPKRGPRYPKQMEAKSEEEAHDCPHCGASLHQLTHVDYFWKCPGCKSKYKVDYLHTLEHNQQPKGEMTPSEIADYLEIKKVIAARVPMFAYTKHDDFAKDKSRQNTLEIVRELTRRHQILSSLESDARVRVGSYAKASELARKLDGAFIPRDYNPAIVRKRGGVTVGMDDPTGETVCADTGGAREWMK